MLIPIGTSSAAEGPDGQPQLREWAMIELQGRIEYAEQQQLEDQVREIGMLRVLEQNKQAAGKKGDAPPIKVELTVGHHHLEGQYVELKKPLLVLDKQQALADQSTLEQQQQHLQYEVRGVIRGKYLFKQRPTALISKPHAR